MPLRPFHFLLLLCAIVLLPVLASAQRVAERKTPLWPEMVFQQGDDRAWADPSFDDRSWKKLERRELPSRSGIYWVRFRVNVGRQRMENPRDTVLLSIVASYDLYWDGRYIGSNGAPASEARAEQPGPVDSLFRAAEMAREGEHVVAMRMSSWHTGFPGTTYGLNFGMVRMHDYLTFRARAASWSVLSVGGAIVLGLVFALMWVLTDRRQELLWFSAICLCAAVMQSLQAWRGFYDYPYPWHYPRLVAISVSSGLTGLMQIGFLAALFKLRRPWLIVIGAAVIMACLWPLHPVYYVKGVYLGWCAFVVSLVIALRAAHRGLRGAWFLLAGIAVNISALIMSPEDFLDNSFVFTFGAVMLGGTIALTLQFRADRRAARQTQLTAARLEIELLKKNIQPHFLMNTLTTIMEVIEQSPKEAVGLIEALAEEFRILARISSERLIPLSQELALCDSHLKIMSLRKGAPALLTVKGADVNALVPPALFHTLLENGLTHLPANRHAPIEFTLSVERGPGFTRYRFVAPIGDDLLPSPGVRTDEPVKDGTGLRYVKARLEESFSGRWTFASGLVAAGWESVIELRGEGGGS